jgi:hypothetical protein
MLNQSLVYLLSLYGLFLITCGIVAVIFIGMKAKTALLSGGMSGCICLVIAYLVDERANGAFPQLAGITVTFALFIVFSWRSTKTLYSIFEMIPSSHPDLKGKGIAFLIISLMALVSLIVSGVQTIYFLHLVFYLN